MSSVVPDPLEAECCDSPGENCHVWHSVSTLVRAFNIQAKRADSISFTHSEWGISNTFFENT